jgi:citrate lyase beta subunit
MQEFQDVVSSIFYKIIIKLENMLLISQNVKNYYNFKLPNDVVLRINLAWCNSLNELKKRLSDEKDSKLFLDLPQSRIKPPNNKYSLDEIVPILESNPQIRYFAVSNVEGKKDLEPFLEKLPKDIIIVPKIESPNAVDNIKEIFESLRNNKKIIMLDHDDLFSSIIKQNIDKNQFEVYIQRLDEFCEKNNALLLRTVGVMFSDDEKRITQYEK